MLIEEHQCQDCWCPGALITSGFFWHKFYQGIYQLFEPLIMGSFRPAIKIMSPLTCSLPWLISLLTEVSLRKLVFILFWFELFLYPTPKSGLQSDIRKPLLFLGLFPCSLSPLKVLLPLLQIKNSQWKKSIAFVQAFSIFPELKTDKVFLRKIWKFNIFTTVLLLHTSMLSLL